MRTNPLFFILVAFSAFLNSQADNYFKIGANDSIRIRPSDVGLSREAPVYGHFDGRLDAWSLSLSYPTGLDFDHASSGPGMAIPYVNQSGTDSICVADLSVNNGGTHISSIIYDFGYWDYNNDGFYDTYGTVKWEAGDYLMFSLWLSPSLTMSNPCYITVSGIMTSTDDWRGGIIGHVTFYKLVTVYVGYRRGDVNGDEVLTITDVNMLTNYVVYETGFTNQYQIDAADVNGDGLINLTDVTILTNMVINGINEVTQEQ